MAEGTDPDFRSKSSPMFATKKEYPHKEYAVIKTEPQFTIKREPLSPVKAEQWTEHVDQLHVSQQGTENIQPSGALQWLQRDTKGVKREIKQERDDNRGRSQQTISTADASSSNENHEPRIDDIKPFKKTKIEKKASKRELSETGPDSNALGQQNSTMPDMVSTKQEDMVTTVPNKQEDMENDNPPKTEDTDDEPDWSLADHTGTVPSESPNTGTVPSESPVIPCDVCGIPFDFVRAMHAHRRTHTEEERKRQVCTVCGVVCADLRELANNCRTHPRVWPPQCRECGQKFKTYKRYKRHRRLESFCVECGTCKEFINKKDFIRHMAKHGKSKKQIAVKSHKCMLCRKGYVTAEGLSEHMSQRHNIKMNDSEKKTVKAHKCMLCNRDYVTAEGLSQHMSQKNPFPRLRSLEFG